MVSFNDSTSCVSACNSLSLRTSVNRIRLLRIRTSPSASSRSAFLRAAVIVFVLFGEAIELGLVALVLVAKLVNSPGNRGQRLLQLFQLPVDDLKVHQPVYLFTQFVSPLKLCAGRKVSFQCCDRKYKPVRRSAARTRMRWAHQDLNLGPAGYEPAALNLAELWALEDASSASDGSKFARQT